jgi:hypothetical protein
VAVALAAAARAAKTEDIIAAVEARMVMDGAVVMAVMDMVTDMNIDMDQDMDHGEVEVAIADHHHHHPTSAVPSCLALRSKDQAVPADMALILILMAPRNHHPLQAVKVTIPSAGLVDVVDVLEVASADTVPTHALHHMEAHSADMDHVLAAMGPSTWATF